MRTAFSMHMAAIPAGISSSARGTRNPRRKNHTQAEANTAIGRQGGVIGLKVRAHCCRAEGARNRSQQIPQGRGVIDITFRALAFGSLT